MFSDCSVPVNPQCPPPPKAQDWINLLPIYNLSTHHVHHKIGSAQTK